MLQTLREFVSYLRVLWREGKALVMGGSLFAVIAIWGLITGKSIPMNLGFLALGVTFVWAGFLAWCKEVQEVARLRAAQGYERPELIFINEEPLFLTQFAKDLTSIQAEKLLKPYYGKWMRLSNVIVFDIEERRTNHHVSGEAADGTGVSMSFQEQWAERILILRRGSKIEIIGQLTDVGQAYVVLENCEISDPSNAPTPTLPPT